MMSPKNSLNELAVSKAKELNGKALSLGIPVISDHANFGDCRSIMATDESVNWEEVISTGIKVGYFKPATYDYSLSSWGRSNPIIRYWKVVTAKNTPEYFVEEKGNRKKISPQNSNKTRLIKSLDRKSPDVVDDVIVKDLTPEGVNAKVDLLGRDVYVNDALPLAKVPAAFFEEVGHLIDPRDLGETTEDFAKWYARHKMEKTSNFPMAKSYPLDLLNRGAKKQPDVNTNAYSTHIFNFFRSYGVNINSVVPINVGPRVIRFALYLNVPAHLSSVKGLKEEMAIYFRVNSVAIFTTEGQLVVDIPRKEHDTVTLREVMETKEFNNFAGPIPLVFGLNQDGTPLIADLMEAPHVLVGGSTRSGKSMFLHSIILALLYRFTPQQIQLNLIDLKRVEFSFYQGFPYGNVQISTEDAVTSIHETYEVMEERYKELEKLQARSVEDANMPYIITVIDEIGDLFALGGRKFKKTISILLRKARAAGIHFIAATQRPSADVIPGEVKANLPLRVAFKVASHVDSGIIMGHSGAEDLLGAGDGLYEDKRFQGCFVTTEEIQKVVTAVKSKYGEHAVREETLEEPEEEE